MSKIVKKYVTAHNPETSESRTFAPGETLPPWAEEIITNQDVFKDDDETAVKDTSPSVEIRDSETYGSDPFRSRSAAQMKALASSHGFDVNTKDEAVAVLEAEGIEPDAEQPTSTNTNVED